jgi:hypothetical protein
VQFMDPTFAGGANRPSLEGARRNFREFGANSWQERSAVRPPLAEEVPPARGLEENRSHG